MLRYYSTEYRYRSLNHLKVGGIQTPFPGIQTGGVERFSSGLYLFQGPVDVVLKADHWTSFGPCKKKT